MENTKIKNKNKNLATTIHKFLFLLFWFASALLILGSFMSFVPGADRNGLIMIAIMFTGGLFIPKKRYQIAALILLLLALWGAYEAHVRGIEYKQWLEKSSH